MAQVTIKSQFQGCPPNLEKFLKWTTGLGAITHLEGPEDQTFKISGGTGREVEFGTAVFCAGAGASSTRFGSSATAAGVSTVSVGNATTCAGARSVSIGASAVCPGDDTVVIGKSAFSAALGDNAVAIGMEANAQNTGQTCVGYRAGQTAMSAPITTADEYMTAIGYAAGVSGTANGRWSTWVGAHAGGASGGTNSRGCVAVGQGARCQGDNSVAVGGSQTVGHGNGAYASQNSVAVGYQAGAFASGAGDDRAVAIGHTTTAFVQSIAIGYSAAAGTFSTDDFNTAIGYDATVGGGNVDYSIGIGHGVSVTAANTFVAGSSAGPINTVFFGKGISHATPTEYVISGTAHATAGSNGADIGIRGGLGGSAAAQSGKINFYIAKNGSGTTPFCTAQIDVNVAASETGLLLSVAGAAVQRVSVGAADSGGAGFRCLRVAN